MPPKALQVRDQQTQKDRQRAQVSCDSGSLAWAAPLESSLVLLNEQRGGQRLLVKSISLPHHKPPSLEMGHVCLLLAHLKALTENCSMLLTTGLAMFSSRRKNKLFHSDAMELAKSFTHTDSALASHARVKHATTLSAGEGAGAHGLHAAAGPVSHGWLGASRMLTRGAERWCGGLSSPVKSSREATQKGHVVTATLAQASPRSDTRLQRHTSAGTHY